MEETIAQKSETPHDTTHDKKRKSKDDAAKRGAKKTKGESSKNSVERASPSTPGKAVKQTGKYRRLDGREHVLLRPSMYVGSMKQADPAPTWIYDEEAQCMVVKDIKAVPGLLKIFDEIIVNAIDHSVRLKEEKRAQQELRKQKGKDSNKDEEDEEDDEEEEDAGEGERGKNRTKAGSKDNAKKTKTIQTVKNIRVNIDRASGSVEITNDGEGIDVMLHVETGPDGKKSKKIYVPELIFGNLLTSANYDDEEEEEEEEEEVENGDPGEVKDGGTGRGGGGAGVDGKGGRPTMKKKKQRIVGGQNGIGAKACNILSKTFQVETVDRRRRLLYRQTFRDNMSIVDPPTIEKCPPRVTPYTTIRFLPDYPRFGLPGGLSDDMHALFVKRVYDATAVTDADVVVHLNGRKLESRSFERYVDLYLGRDAERVYERINDWWEIAAACSDGDGMQQVSFVNGISTRGGRHVDHIVQQIARKLTDTIASKRGNKDIAASLKPQFVRDNLFVFVKATIPNPDFDSQSKSVLNTPVGLFNAPGGRVEVGKAFVDKLYKTALVSRVMSLNDAVMDRNLKKTDGKKQGSVYGIPKLDDANWAGGPKSAQCTLILTEGDSAKTMALGGLDQAARDRFGVFPLRGKVMNVCGKQAQQVMANAEIAHLKTILGLETGKVYHDVSELRYGRIMIMTDQDADGSHIKGLLFNLFHQMWPSLLKLDGFFTSLLTPIVKATRRGQPTLSFYSMADYRAWLQSHDGGKGYEIKYYKGLGTSTRAEAKEYFRDLKMANYRWTDQASKDSLNLAFLKTRADDRKRWLMSYDRREGLDFGLPEVTFDDFINKDLIHFSNYDVVRSIPSVCDGLKPSQRKILFACFKRNLVSQIKVAQLAGYVSEKAAYHHGEDSLNATIVGLAQDFVGSNNINLLQPVGQFGSRNMGGKDASAARYIFTCFTPLTPMLFMRQDEGLLDYMEDDGYPVEPDYYIPILPMVLVNGVTGIGTGFSSDVPSYNPEDLVEAVRACLDAADPSTVDMSGLHPWARGFKGTIERMDHAPPLQHQQHAQDESVVDTVDSVQTSNDAPRSPSDGCPTALLPQQTDDDRCEAGSFSTLQTGDKGERFCSRGVFKRLSPTQVVVSELPLGYWTSDFKEHVDRLKHDHPGLGIKAVKHNHTDVSVACLLTFNSPASLDAMMEMLPGTASRPAMTRLEKELRLVATRNLTTTNMHLYDRSGRIRKYASIKDIVLEHFSLRLEAYGKRKRLMLGELEDRELLLSEKIRFLECVIDGGIAVQKKSKAELEIQLTEHGFVKRTAKGTMAVGGKAGDTDDAAEQENANYDYLIKMPIYTLTSDKKRELEKELQDVREAIHTTRSTSERDMWKRDLEAFLTAYRKWTDATSPAVDEEDPVSAIASGGGTEKERGGACSGRSPREQQNKKAAGAKKEAGATGKKRGVTATARTSVATSRNKSKITTT